jgi:hypothetical protein
MSSSTNTLTTIQQVAQLIDQLVEAKLRETPPTLIISTGIDLSSDFALEGNVITCDKGCGKKNKNAIAKGTKAEKKMVGEDDNNELPILDISQAKADFKESKGNKKASAASAKATKVAKKAVVKDNGEKGVDVEEKGEGTSTGVNVEGVKDKTVNGVKVEEKKEGVKEESAKGVNVEEEKKGEIDNLENAPSFKKTAAKKYIKGGKANSEKEAIAKKMEDEILEKKTNK